VKAWHRCDCPSYQHNMVCELGLMHIKRQLVYKRTEASITRKKHTKKPQCTKWQTLACLLPFLKAVPPFTQLCAIVYHRTQNCRPTTICTRRPQPCSHSLQVISDQRIHHAALQQLPGRE
jgi:hypothetical protein